MESRTWNARPILSRLLRLFIFVLPIGVSVAVAYLASALMPRPSSLPGMVAWWVIFVLALTVPAALCIRLTRGLLPMAALLKLTLVFPDRAPSRLEVAKRAGRTRDLKKRLREQGEGGESDEAAVLVLALITSLGEHDRLTRGHSERVRAFTDMLAEKLALSPEDRNKLRWAALLHDVGKLEVATEILNKPGLPTDEEWSVLQRHPIGGLRLLGPLADWLDPWTGAVADHHERWDGTGYPRRLQEENISLGGRILAIADSYEVMTAARAYKRPMTAEAARTELTRCAGSHFDPRLVREFLEISVGRLWIAIGLGALLAQLPVLSGLSYRGLTERFGRSVATAAGAVGTVAALALGGAVDVPPGRPEGPALVLGSGEERPSGGSESSEDGSDAGEPGRRGVEGPEGDAGAEAGDVDVPAPATEGDPPTPGEPPAGEDPPGRKEEPREERPEKVVATGDVLGAALLDPTIPGATESEFLSSCSTPSTQGVDAWVFPLPGEGAERDIDLSVEPAAGGDAVNVRTYSADCEELGGLFQERAFAVPSRAAWMVVVPTRSLATTVTLEVTIPR